MAKLSKSTQWILIFAVTGGIAAYVFTEPEGGKKNRKPHSTATRSTAPEGFKPEDMTAQFPRLTGAPRNVFVPKVVVKKNAASAAAGQDKLSVTPPKPTWALTGIFVQNGVRMALLENAATAESQTIKVGQSWMGQAVLSIKPEGVLFSNGTQMVFAAPPEESPTTPATVAATAAVSPVLLPGAPTVPSGVTVPAAPLTIPAPEGSTNPGRGRRRANASGTNSLRLNLPPEAAPTQPTGNQP